MSELQKHEAKGLADHELYDYYRRMHEKQFAYGPHECIWKPHPLTQAQICEKCGRLNNELQSNAAKK